MDVYGIFIEQGELQFAHLRKQTPSIEIKLLKRVDPAQLPDLLAPNTKIVSGLDCDELVLRKISLKLKNRFAIRKILPFQAEASLPYSSQETILLPLFQKGERGSSEILLFATTKSLLQEHLNKLPIDPDQTSCASLAIVRFARHYFPAEQNLFFIHFGREKSFCGLVLNGMLQQVYTFSLGESALLEAFTQDAHDLKEIYFAEIDKTRFPHLFPIRLSLQKELDRALAFIKKKSRVSSDKLLLTGSPLNFLKMREYLENTSALTVLQNTETSQLLLYAVPIGLALEGVSKDGHTADFRQGEFISSKVAKRRKKLLMSYLVSCVLLTLLIGIGGHRIVTQKKDHLSQELKRFVSSKNIQDDDLERSIESCEEDFSKEKPPFPTISTAYKVSDVLAWLSTHPLLSNEIDIKEVHYELVKYPKLNAAIEPYVAKVQLKLCATTPIAARQFREALMKGDGLVNPKQEISWNVEQNVYRTSFYLRGCL